MTTADDTELLKRLRTLSGFHDFMGSDEHAALLKEAADRIEELRMVRTMLYKRLNEMCEDNAELQRRVEELEAII